MLYTEKENGWQIVVRPGQIIRIGLNSNPTTGFNWTFQNQPDPSVIKMQKAYYRSDRENRGLLGTGGRQYWTWKALATGRTSLKLGYGRSWENAAPVQTYCLLIEVR